MSTTLKKTGLKLPDGLDVFSRATYNENIQKIEDLTNTLYPVATLQNMNMFVRTDGNDANDGSANDAAHAFKTVTKAISIIPQIVNHTVTVNIAAGTYAENVNVYGFIGKGTIVLQGDATATNTRNVIKVMTLSCTCSVNIIGIYSTTPASDYAFYAGSCSYVIFNYCRTDNMQLTSYGVYAQNSNVYCANCILSNKTSAIQAYAGGKILSENNTGLGNSTSYVAAYGGMLSLGSNGAAITGTTIFNSIYGGLFINADGTIGGAVGSSMMGTGTAFSATTGTFSVTMDGSVKYLVPTGNCILNASGGYVGQKCSIIIQTSGATSYTMTFSGNFKAAGAITTGTIGGKYFVVGFVYISGVWIETDRTVAI